MDWIGLGLEKWTHVNSGVDPHLKSDCLLEWSPLSAERHSSN